MKHLFSSGEVMYKKNQKNLTEGLFVGDFLEYQGVDPDTEFACVGRLNDKHAKVCFSLSEDDYESVKMRFTFKILMQSDLLSAGWKKYEVKYID